MSTNEEKTEFSFRSNISIFLCFKPINEKKFFFKTLSRFSLTHSLSVDFVVLVCWFYFFFLNVWFGLSKSVDLFVLFGRSAQMNEWMNEWIWAVNERRHILKLLHFFVFLFVWLADAFLSKWPLKNLLSTDEPMKNSFFFRHFQKHFHTILVPATGWWL